jgi:hypothetical protein
MNINALSSLWAFAYLIFQIAACVGVVLIPIAAFVSELCGAKANAGRR